jgi:hypothetical protein
MHEVAPTEFKQQSEQHDLEHHIGRHFQEMKGRAGSFVAGSPATPALRPGITEIGGNGKLSGLLRSAMRTVHPSDPRY